MLGKINLLGAVVAHVIFISSILTFITRMLEMSLLEKISGYILLLMTFPLVYLLIKAPSLNRPVLYYIQIAAMLAWIVMVFMLDYVFMVDFRQTRWIVIVFVMLFFAGVGGMLGIAANAGRSWTISAVVLFLIMAVLAFVQRAVTGQ
jgi:hypothetical protein